MGSLGDELSLGSMPISISGFQVSKILNVAMEKSFELEKYVKKLEDEKMKIESCKLEVPLCLEILNDAIVYLKEEYKRFDTQPLLKDFISLNKPFRESDDGIVMPLLKRDEIMKEQWKANDHISNLRFSDTKIKNTVEIERTPKVETGLGLGLTSSSMFNGGRKGIASCVFTSNSMQQPPQPPQPPPFLQQQASRKQRRCWTPELHRRFVDALQQLGGSGVATPKQIRDHMQEDGLTNDEVKSHLQKYRLHIRKPNLNSEKQSVVVLGFKLWDSSQEEETGEGGEASKRSNSQSDSHSPQGPLHLPSTTTSSIEDTEDAKSESFQIERC